MRTGYKPLFRSVFFLTLFIHAVFHGHGQTDSLQLKIGQMIMIGVSGKSVDTASVFYKDVQHGRLGGIVLYEANLTEENAAENLQLMISQYQAAAPLPLFVAITQEGGLVNRLKTKYGFPPMPSAEYLGRLQNDDSTKYYADNTAFTLSRLGINVNFAPVVDIYRADNPVLGSRQRTYSEDVNVITQQASIVIASHDYFNVNTVLKHFPGHGSSTTDTHLGMTDVSASWTQNELEPYRRLIKQGKVKAVMTAHIINRPLDADGWPATLSDKMINGLLRRQLHFDGVVFSDDMHMKAISAEYGLEQAIQKAIEAGVDVLLFSGNIPGVTQDGATTISDLIYRLVAEGKISRERIDRSYKRILKMKQEQH